MLADFNQWSSAEPYIGNAKPSYVGGDDQLRIGSYSLYEQIYWTIPTVFEVVWRGIEDNSIYIPSGRQIVETMHRYLANKLRIISDPSFGTDVERQTADLALTALLRRERFYSKFSSAKRYGIMQGDWLFHITADDTRPEGSRISITPMDPAMYFPIENPDNVDEIIGAHLAFVEEVEGETFLHRTTYRKVTGKGGPSPLTVEEALYNIDSSGLPGIDEGSPVQVVRPPTQLPPLIDQIPIYHIQHFDQPGTVWGSSEIRGLERLQAAINQGVSDEELTLALEGLGVYHCDGGAPVDPDSGEEVAWNIGPARVVEHPKGTQFGRVSGVTSIAPYQDHQRYLHGQLDQAAAISEVAKGRVDVQAAESGVALLIELGPLLAKVEEKEQVVTDVQMNMFFDLRKWLTQFENMRLDNVIWIPTYGEKLPTNRKQKFDEIIGLLGTIPPVVTGAWARGELRKLGYEFPEEAQFAQEIIQQSTSVAQITADVIGARMNAAIGNGKP